MLQSLLVLLTLFGAASWTSAAFATTSINKQFTLATIDPGNISKFRITIANTALVQLTAAAVTDNLPAQVTISSSLNIVNTCGFTGVTATPGTSQVKLTGGTIPANTGPDGQCYFEVDVTGTAAGNWINTIPANGPTIGFTIGGNTAGYQATENTVTVTNTTPASATLAVRGLTPPTGTKSFSPATIYAGENSTLTIVLTNPSNNGTTLPLTTFTDPLPTGLQVAATPAASVNCTGTGAVNGTFTPAPDATTLTMTGGTIGGAAGSGGTCTLTVAVKATAQGTLTNTVPANAIGNTRGLSSVSFNGVLTTTTPIGVTKSFAPTTVGPDQDSILTITITNASTTVPLTVTSLTDTLPTLLSPARAVTVGNVVETPPTIDCVTNSGGTNGTFSPALVQGASSITLTNAVVGTAGARTCTITVPVRGSVSTATTNSAFNNNILNNAVKNPGNFTSATTGNVSLTVSPNITVTKTRFPTSAAPGVDTTYTVAISNWSGVDLTNVNFADSLPVSNIGGFQMVLATAPTFTGTGACLSASAGGTVTATPGASSVSWTGFKITKGASAGVAGVCTITFKAVAPQNTTSGRTFTNSLPAGTAICNTVAPLTCNPVVVTAQNFTVTPAATLVKSFTPSAVVTGQSSVLTITIKNNTGAPVTNATLTDTFPAGLVVAASPGIGGTCISGGGALTQTGGGALVGGEGAVKLSAVTIGAAGSVSNNCTVTVNVTGATGGSYSNTLPSGALTTAEGVTNPAASTTVSLSVSGSPVTISKGFSSGSKNQSQTNTLTVTLANSSGTALTQTTVTDNLPNGVTIAAAPTASTTCGGAVTAVAGGSVLGLSGGTIPANGSCTFKANVIGSIVGTATNTIPIGAVSTFQGYSNPAAATASFTVTNGTNTVSKAFNPTTIYQPDSSLLTVTLTNGATVPMTGANLTDPLTGGVVVAAVPAAGTTCSAGTVTADPGATSIGIAGATVPASGSCTFYARVVDNTTTGTLTNTIPANALSNDLGSTYASNATATLTVNPGITGTKTFTPTAVGSGGKSRVSIQVNNVSTALLTGVAVTDPLGANLAVANSANASTTCAGSPVIIATPGAATASLTGASIPASGNCLFLFDVVTSGTPASWANTLSIGNITSTEGPKNTTAISATLSRDTSTSININKSFNPVIVTGGQPSVLRIDVTNPIGSPSGADNVTFTDSFPAGIEVYAVPNAHTDCANGVVTATPGGGSVTLSGATLPANSTCSVYVTTTSVKFLNLTNTIGAGAVTTTQLYTNSLPTEASLTTLQGLGASKSFTPTSISAGQTARLKIKLVSTRDKNQPGTQLTGVSFTDSLPAGLTVAATSNATTNCTSGSVTATAASNLVTLSGAVIDPETSCLVEVDVTASTLGMYTNTIPKNSLTSNEGFKNTFDAIATLNVVNPPVITKVFNLAAVKAGQASTLTVTITNSNAQTFTGAALTDTLPSGVTVAGIPNASTTCTDGTVSAAVAATSITLVNATIPASGSCTFSADVVSNTPGAYPNTIPIGALTTIEGASNTEPANATLTVLQPPTLSKSFSPTAIGVNETSVLTLTLGNSNASAVTLSQALTDTLPGVLKVANPNGLTQTCPGTVTAAANGSTITYANGASIPTGGCTIQVNVTGAQASSNLNLIPAAALQTSAGNNPAEATATLDVYPVADLAIAKTDGVASVNAGGGTIYTIAVTNNGPSEVTAAPVLDTAPAGLTFSAWTCAVTTAGTGSVTTACGAASGSGNLNTTVTMNSGAVITYTVAATVAGSATGSLANTATVTVPNGTTDPTPGNNSATDIDTVTPAADLAITKTDGVTSVNAGGSTLYTITVTNNGPSEISAGALADSAPAGVTFGAWTCAVTTAGTGGTVTTACGAASGSGNLATSVTMKNGAVITYTVNATVAVTASGSLVNTATIAPPVGTTDLIQANNSASDTDTLIPTYSIGDFVWYDTNQDGIQVPSEPGLAGVTVRLFNEGGNPLATTTTDGAGHYRFDGLVSGSYKVQFAPPIGLGYQLSPVGAGTGPLADSFDSDAAGSLFETTVTLATASDVTVDAGFYRPGIEPARIGDRVWYDTNHDGIQDSGELGLAGVTVSLYADVDANGTPDGAAITTSVSDGNGDYAFTGLPAGKYVLEFSAPTGYTRSPMDAGGTEDTDSDANATTGRTATIELAAGQAIKTVDAGLYLTGTTAGIPGASLGDRVWYDVNGDGIQDGGETGIPGVLVQLYDATGTTLLGTTLTAPDGTYGFSGLAAGSYTVAFVAPTGGYVFSPTGAAGTSATDSDPDPLTGRVSVLLDADQVRSDIDAGLRVPGQTSIGIGDAIWLDGNGNGVQNAGEGLPNVEVVLYDGLGNELARVTTTSADANYGFSGLPAGANYRVAVDTSTITGLAQLADPDTAFDNRHDLIGLTNTTDAVDFGYLTANGVVEIVKRAADDSDTQQVVNGGTANFEIIVRNAGNLTLTNITVADLLAPACNHTIASLAPGASSEVRECSLSPVSTGFTNNASVSAQPVDGGNNPVGPPVTATDTTAVTVINPAIQIEKTATNSPVTAGGTATFSITVTNIGDVTLTNVEVSDPLATGCARTVAGANVIGTLVSGAHITYTCDKSGVTAPFFNVATVTGTTPLSTTVTDDDDAYVNVVTPGLSITKSPDAQTIRKNGTATFTITVTNTGDVELETVAVSDPETSDCDRTNVGPLAAKGEAGDSKTYECTLTGVLASFDNTITATSGALTVSDTARVNVIDPSISVVKTTNGSDGPALRQGFLVTWRYLVTNTGDVPLTSVGVLDSEGVTVTCPQTTLAAGAAMTCFGYGQAILGDYSNTATVSGTPPNGTAVTAQDTSHYTGTNPAVIGNRVWLDENGDGVQDAGESGIPNLVVQLFQSDGTTLVASTVTDTLGGYLFTEVTPGSYVVRVTPTTDLNPTWNEDTGTTSPDSETTVTVAAGEDHLTADFGYNWVPSIDSTNPSATTTGAIGDRVWIDTDGDGLQDVGEAGLGGVQVTLTGAGPDGIFGNADDPAPVVKTTDAAGNYIFDGLIAGSYKVTATPPTGAWTQTGDPDLGGSIDNTTTTPIVLAPGDVYVNADFGYQPAAGSRIGDTIWFDANNDGSQNVGELGIPGVTVALQNEGFEIIATTVTNGLGQYLFEGLPGGTYTVVVTDTNHLLDAQLSDDPDATKDARTTVTVTGTDSVLTADFGYTALNMSATTGLIGDFVFLDRDGNGMAGPGEGLQGVTVRLYASNGTTLLAETVTNPVGVYGFGGLDATGTYVVKIVEGTLPNGGTGLTNTIDPDLVSGANDSQSTVDLSASGGRNLLQDFGYQALTNPASIGGLIWEDADADGIHQHPPGTVHQHLAGITVALLDGSGNLVATTVTDNGGLYLFSGLPAGSYTVAVTDTAGQLTGWWHSVGDQNPTVDENSKNTPFTVAVAAGETNTNIDFGYYRAGAALGNRVWYDANANGIQDLAETAGISGVPVQLVISYPLGGSTTLVVTSGADGGYRFGNLLLDERFNGQNANQPTYVISVLTAPASHVASPTGQGTSLTDANNPAGTIATVLKGQTATSVQADPSAEGANAGFDFGYTATATVSGHLYIDTNGDGHQDPGEPNLANVDVIITDATGAQTLTSDANGNYTATVVVGPVTVDVNNGDLDFPIGYIQTEGSDPTSLIATTGANNAGIDGYTPPTSILGTVSGHLYIDTNGNGTQQAGEPNLAGVDVLITDKNGGTQTVTSDINGNYSASVPAGATSANILETDPQFPTGYTQTQGEDPTSVTAVAATNTSIGIDGYAPPTGLFGTVNGHLYIDTNRDGTQDEGEPNLANVDVLITDVNGGTRTVSTDASGNYSASVPAGNTTANVQEGDPQFPIGYTQTEGEDPTSVTAVAATNADIGIDGYAPPEGQSGTVFGHLYIDSNGNGVQDGGEPDLADVDVIVTDLNGGIHRVTSDANGDYSATDIPAGTATVDVDNKDPQYPTGYTQTEGTDPTPVTVLAGESVSAGNDGYQPPVGSIGNRVWLDENGDGVQDAGEAGIANVTVELYAAGATPGHGSVLQTTVTDANGGYLFTVEPGTYQVYVAQRPAALQPTFDEDGIGTGSENLIAGITVVAGDEYMTADFGYNWVKPGATTDPDTDEPGALGDRIWNDANGDGVQDPGEAGLVGAQVTILHDADSNGVFDTVYSLALNPDGTVNGTGIATTDATGNYIFAGLLPGAYVVSVDPATLPTGFNTTPTGDPDGDRNNVSLPILIAPGDVFVNADFGYKLDTDTNPSTGTDPAGGSTIGDRIWLDADGDGSQDAGEPGIPGVTVALLDNNDDVIATTATDADGVYLFPGLPAGTYTVVVTDTDNVLGDPDAVIDRKATTTVNGSADDLDQDFGFAPNGANPDRGFIGDTVFMDRDGNGQPGIGEGLEGVVVALYDATGTQLLASTTTNENGTYGFGGLDPAATYEVRVDPTTLPNGGLGLTNTVDPDSGADSTALRNLVSTGPVDLGADFGYRVLPGNSPNTIAGTIWADRNADGTLTNGSGGTPNETGNGIAGVTVALYEDINSDGQLDGGDFIVATTVTGADGGYAFSGLPDGKYLVQVTDDAGVLTGAWKSDGPADGTDNNSQPAPYAVTVQGGDVNKTGDFGYYAALAALGNRVWADDRNGVQQSGELGIANVKVTLTVTYPNGDVSTLVTLTDANGGYRFGNLLADERFNGVGPTGQGGTEPSYEIKVETPAGYAPSPISQGTSRLLDSDNPAGTMASLIQGQDNTTVQLNPSTEPVNVGYDFGFTPQGPVSCSSICDVVSPFGSVTMDDIRWLMSNRGKRVTLGAANSGDCVADGVISVNDVQACRKYLSP